jgi:hypothetical protein
MRHSCRLVSLVFGLWCLAALAPAAGAVGQPAGGAVSAGRARAQLIRSGIQIHRGLRRAGVPTPLPPSNVLPDAVSRAKRYGDSWTCRSSSCMLSSKLAGAGQALAVDSVGKNAFRWGREGRVSYHYFGVDNVARPTVLLDPTAVTNFANDVRPGGLLHRLLDQAGQRMGQASAAQRVAWRIAKGGFDGLLVLASPAEIAVYKEALEQAAALRAHVTRNAERR